MRILNQSIKSNIFLAKKFSVLQKVAEHAITFEFEMGKCWE